MKLHWSMPEGLKRHYEQELTSYRLQFQLGSLAQAWRHLERAHILGQAWPREHTKVHWIMLRFGIHIKSLGEIFGQIPRLFVGGVKSFVGKIPTGNTGGANVPALRPMEIPDDLMRVINQYNDHGIGNRM